MYKRQLQEEFDRVVDGVNALEMEALKLGNGFVPKEEETPVSYTHLDAAKAVKAKVIDEKKKQAQRQLEDVQTDYQNEMLEIYNGLASKVYDVLASYAQQQGFTLVVDATQPQQQPPVILWSSPSTDITRPVIEAYNAKSGVPAPPAPVPAAPKPASTAPKPAGGAPAAH